MRIVAGAWRGRTLTAPVGIETRPTADRVRQALFDMLMHAPYAGRAVITGAVVLDVFAGTGAMGLEALSRGAASCVFVESAKPALAALRANIAACGAEDQCRVLALDALALPRGDKAGLVFLDPPYGRDLVARAVTRLHEMGWIGAGSLIVAEMGRDEAKLAIEAFAVPASARRAQVEVLAERRHGAARVTILRVV